MPRSTTAGHRNRISIVAHASIVRGLGAFVLAAVMLLGATGCTTPCKKLANRLCEMSGDDNAQCERWKDRTSRVPTETCEAGLRALDRDRIR